MELVEIIVGNLHFPRTEAGAEGWVNGEVTFEFVGADPSKGGSTITVQTGVSSDLDTDPVGDLRVRLVAEALHLLRHAAVLPPDQVSQVMAASLRPRPKFEFVFPRPVPSSQE
jgi:hypothetical protein